MGMVYLSGPMEDVTKEEAGEWRDEATKFLKKHGHTVYDPTCRTHMDHKTIVEFDINEIEKSDMLLTFFPMTKKIRLIGTSMEIFYANRILRRPTILWGHECNNSHPWVFQNASHIFLHLKDALEYVRREL